MQSDFDAYRGTYEEAIAHSIAFSGREHAFFLKAKARQVLDVVRRRLGEPERLRALDVGCGPGHLDAYLIDHFEAFEGVDLSEAMVEEARRRNPQAVYHRADARRLPLGDRAFDLALAICLIHHVPAPERQAVVSELRRVTRPDGLVVVVEHNPLNPLTRLAVARCAFDEDVVLMRRKDVLRRFSSAGLRTVESRYFLVFPWSARPFQLLERALAPLPLGAQYYVAAYA